MYVYSTEGKVWGFARKGWCPQGQNYSNRSAAERTTDHTNVKILNASNKVDVVNWPQKPSAY